MKKLALPLTVVFALVAVPVALAAGLLSLPAAPVTVSHGPWNAGTMGSTIDVALSNVGAGFDVTDGTYPGWCIEDNHMQDAPNGSLLTLYDSTDASLPAGLAGPWDKVNYLLNHKQGTAQDVQVALWLLTSVYDGTFPLTPAAQAMFDDANANGAGFVPGAGQVIAVIVYADGFSADGYQDTLIEVIPGGDEGGPGTGTPGYWKNHPEAWPVDSITIGEDTYTKEQAIALISMPDGDKSYTLFRAYVSAYLNVQIGNDSSCVASTLVSAYDWLNIYEPGSKVKASSDAWKLGEPLYLLLDNYNNGLLCAPHRD